MVANLTTLFNTFITASHILHYHGVLDAYGHMSFRNPNNASTFFMSRNIAPALIASPSDIVEYLVSDASPVDPNAPQGFIERYIHSELFKRYENISSVVHSHSPEVIPYSIAGVPLRPVIHMAGFLGTSVPVFNITRYYNTTQRQDLLVRTPSLGAALAATFSADPLSTTPQASPDHAVVLMQAHGFTTAATSMELATVQAVYTQVDAGIQTGALTIRNAYYGGGGNGGDPGAKVAYLMMQQAADTWASIQGTADRPWGLWRREVETSGLYRNTLDVDQIEAASPVV